VFDLLCFCSFFQMWRVFECVGITSKLHEMKFNMCMSLWSLLMDNLCRVLELFYVFEVLFGWLWTSWSNFEIQSHLRKSDSNFLILIKPSICTPRMSKIILTKNSDHWSAFLGAVLFSVLVSYWLDDTWVVLYWRATFTFLNRELFDPITSIRNVLSVCWLKIMNLELFLLERYC